MNAKEPHYVGNLNAYREHCHMNGGWQVNPITAYEYYTNRYGWTRRFINAGNTRGEERFSSKEEAEAHALAWVAEAPDKRLAVIR
jgi:hypothetical protein